MNFYGERGFDIEDEGYVAGVYRLSMNEKNPEYNKALNIIVLVLLLTSLINLMLSERLQGTNREEGRGSRRRR